MWKALWKKWTIDKPALLGDLLWEVLVVKPAAFLDWLTWRRMIALIPVATLIAAYYHRIPLPPELMLVGDLLAYIDIFSVLVVLGILSRTATVLFIIKQVTIQVGRLANSLVTKGRRSDYRRERGTKRRKRLTGQSKSDDDGFVINGGVAWA
jgi:hypothetical protein